MVWRIRDRSTFVALRRSRHRIRRGPLTLTWLPGQPDEPPRVAFAVGRKVGGAARRNRLRRRLRAVVGEVEQRLPPGAYIIAAAPEAAELSHGELRATVTEAIDDLAAGGQS